MREERDMGAGRGGGIAIPRLGLLALVGAIAALALLPAAASAQAPELLAQSPEDGLPGAAAGRIGQFGSPQVAADPNLPGNVYLADPVNHRIDVFDPWGQFLYAFGWKVNASNPEEKLQRCTAESGCLQGTEGTGPGQLVNPEALATDGEGNLYVAEGAHVNTLAAYGFGNDVGNHRVQKFSPTGEFLYATGGDVVAHGPGDSTNDEVQKLTIAASEGTFKLGFENPWTGGGLAENKQETAPLPYNASAAEVQAALNALSVIGGLGGSVKVSGGPGDATGSKPYEIVFEGNLAGDDVPELSVDRSALGAAAIGATLRCSTTTEADSYEYRWLRNGVPIAGAESPTYTTVAADEGKSVQCQVRVQSANGGSIQAANPVYVAPPAGAPAPPVAPAPGTGSNGTFTARTPELVYLKVGGPGGELLCNKGEWSGATSFAYAWYRNGVKIEGASEPTYLATEADLASPAYFQCEVTASNAGTASTTEFSGVALSNQPRTSPPPDHLEDREEFFPRVRMDPPSNVFTANQGGGDEVCTAGDACKAGRPGPGPAQFPPAGGGGPSLAASPLDGAVFLGDGWHERVTVFNGDGSYREEIAMPVRPAFQRQSFDSLAAAPDGGLYASLVKPSSSTGQVREIRRMAPHGPAAELSGPAIVREGGELRALAADAAGDLFLGEGKQALEYDAAGNCLLCGADGEGGLEGFDRILAGENLYHQGLGVGEACGAADAYVATTGRKTIGGVDTIFAYLRIYGPPPDPEACPQPVRPPEISSQYAASVGTDNAVLRARINPKFWNDTRYYLQYGTAPCSEGGCTSTPAPPGSLLTSKVTQAQIKTPGVVLEGLQPGTTYHYRFVAQSGGGGPVRGVGGSPGEDGAEGVFRSFAESGEAPACPENEAFRTAASAALPDCRAYEMVSPVDKEGGDVIVQHALDTTDYPAVLLRSSLDGERLVYGSYRAFGDAEAAGYTSQYLATRGEGGWSSDGISPPRERLAFPLIGELENELKALSPDLCESWWRTFAEPKLAPGAVEGFANLYRRREAGCGGEAGGSWEALTTVALPHPWGSSLSLLLAAEMQGTSADGSRAIYAASDNLTADAPDLGGKGLSLYYQEEGEGAPHFVCILPSGEPTGGSCTAGYLNSDGKPEGRSGVLRGAISTDGQRVFWTDRGAGAGQIYLRQNPGQPQSALAHGFATGTGKLTEGSTTVTSLVAALGKAEFTNGSKEVKLLSTEVGRFLAGQPVAAPGKIPTGASIASCLPECGRAAKTLVLDKAATASSPEANISSKGPQPFEVGQAISGKGVPPGTTVTEAKGGELKLSKAASVTESGVALSATSECTEAAKACTIAVSAGGEALSGAKESQFLAAAPDGSAAIYTAINTEAGVSTLYRFDVEARKTTAIAGKVLGVAGTSEGLSRIYFVSIEALTGANAEGREPVAGARNVYLYEEGEPGHIAFVATLGAEDAGFGAGEPIQNATRVSGDGLHLAFMSAASLTGYDNTDAVSGEADSEVYLYDASGNGGQGKLVCASCNPTGARPAGEEDRQLYPLFDWVAGQIPTHESSLYATRVLSEDGSRLFFESTDALTPRDTNGAMDVYEWEAAGSGDCQETSLSYAPANGGCVSLISSGHSPAPSEFIDADPSGDNAFFTTLSGLAPQDQGLVDVYDARVGGGFPAPPRPAVECEGEACQGTPEAPNDPTPASESFQGAGNVPAEEPKARTPKPCAKGKVRRKGKCVARKHKRHAKRNRRAAR